MQLLYFIVHHIRDDYVVYYLRAPVKLCHEARSPAGNILQFTNPKNLSSDKKIGASTFKYPSPTPHNFTSKTHDTNSFTHNSFFSKLWRPTTAITTHGLTTYDSLLTTPVTFL